MLAPRRLGMFASVTVALLLTAACGDEGTSAARPATSVTDSSSSAAVTTVAETVSTDAPANSVAPVAGVPEILQFSAPLVGGGTFDGATYGGTPLALWFWAPG